MKTLTKDDLVEMLQNLGYSTKESKLAAGNLIATLKGAILTKKLVYIPKFMKIGSSVKNERPGRNPKTGEAYTISSRHSVRGGTGSFPHMTDKLTKSNFIDTLRELGYTPDGAAILVNVFYNFISNIREGETRIEIRGLGTFYTAYRKAKTVRNPKTGTAVEKEAHYHPMFKCSPELRKAMDKKYL